MKIWLLIVLLAQNAIEKASAQGQAGCNDHIDTLSPKIIFSPNYPDDYGSFRICKYVIKRANSNVCKVKLKVIRFILESDSNCLNDYLDLGEGYTGTGSTRLCGNLIASTEKELTFKSDTLTMIFKSDGVGSSMGFSIKVQQVPDSCFGVETRTDIPTYACNYNLQGKIITITSPNYPFAYNPNQQCTYVVRKLDSSVCSLRINFDSFNLDGNQNQCFGDYLELASGEKLCGQQSFTRTISVDRGRSNLAFKFVSNGYDQRGGFRITIDQLQNSCFGGGRTTTIRPPVGDCRVELKGISGTIISPGHPQQYPSQVRCTYIIKRYDPSVCKVELNLRSFDIKGGFGCQQEYLQLDNGERLCGRLSGKKMLEFKGSKGDMVLTFQTSSSFRTEFHSGFKIDISQIASGCRPGILPPFTGGCNEIITGESMTIRSPGYNIGQYSNNLRCLYTIRRIDSSACIVDVDLNISGIEEAPACSKDSLKLPNSEAICGRDKTLRRRLYFSNNDELKIEFTTDYFVTGRGFEMKINQRRGTCSGVIFPTNRPVTIPPRSCSETFNTKTFYIKSPGFQEGRYYPNQYCEYRVKKQANNMCALQLKYLTFNLEESDDCTKDYFDINGVKHCGTLRADSVRTYQFTKDTEVLKFSSDSNVNSKGFFIEGNQLSC